MRATPEYHHVFVMARSALLVTLLFGVLVEESAAAQPRATFDLVALEREIDEGQVAQFIIENKEYVDPSTGQIMRFEADLSPVEWNFGDDRQSPASAYGLYDIKHWFADDKDGPFTVTAAHQGTTEEITIEVNDVAPVIHSVSVTENARVNQPVVFQAAVRDPGFFDEVTFLWDFGEGDTAEGRNAIHRWNQEGTYEVTLSVEDKDGDDPPQTVKFSVDVGSFHDDQAANTFTVAGDFSASEAQIDSLILVGSTGNVTGPEAGGGCQLRIEMRSREVDMGVVLTANLYPGLAPGHYTIGETEEWDGAHVQDVATQGTFFAEFFPPQDQDTYELKGQIVGGPFWSERGRVTVTRFEAGELELFFEAVLIENIAVQVAEPRRVAVRGALAASIPEAVTASDVTEPSDETQLPGTRILRESLREMSGVLWQEPDTFYYGCPGEEPEEFEIVGATPEANEVVYNFEDAAVSLEFSQTVDSDTLVHPDTLEDNLLLGVLTEDGRHRRVEGSWMISRENPKFVDFIPQARLIPGAIHCIYVAGGDKGVRSFTGNVLGGSSLEAPADQMAQACRPQEGYVARLSFATRVELESIGNAFYGDSLLGPHAKPTPAFQFQVRVYPWWQDALDDLHPSVLVKKFDARVYAVLGGEASLPRDDHGGLHDSGSYFETELKRPDLYTAGEIDAARHSVEFLSAFFPNQTGPVEFFSVVQPLNGDMNPREPVYRSLVEQVTTAPQLPLKMGVLEVQSDCADDLAPVDCGWEPVYADLGSRLLHRFQVVELIYTQPIGVTAACPGGIVDGECYPSTLSAEQLSARLQGLANEIVGNRSVYSVPRPEFDVLVAKLPRGWIPEPHQGIFVFVSESLPSAIFIDDSRYEDRKYRRELAQALLKDEACKFEGDSICDQTPVQALAPVAGIDGLTNKHHGEVSRALVPLVTRGALDSDPAAVHISAYNFAKLYEVVEELRASNP